MGLMGFFESPLPTVKESRTKFEQAVHSNMKDPHTHAEVTFIYEMFNRIEEQETSAAHDRKSLRKIRQDAVGLSRLRAYVYPITIIEMQGEAMINTLQQENLPGSAFDLFAGPLKNGLTCGDDAKQRAAFHTILQEYDEWLEYIYRYDEIMLLLSALLALAIFALTYGAFDQLKDGSVFLGVILAGLSGACTSVISKLPSITTAEGYVPYLRGAIRRIAVGFTGSIIGLAFLASGIVTISVPSHGAIDAILKRIASVQPTSQIENTSEKDAKGNPVDVLIIVAIVMAFGLSERALTVLEDRVMPGSNPRDDFQVKDKTG